jgi:hypothetical protein
MREKLVNTILEPSVDEMSLSEVEDIVRENEEQLVDRLISITEYYVREYNQ